MLHVLAEEALQVKSHCTSATFPHSSCKWNDGHDEELPGAFARPLRRSHDHVVPRDFLPPPNPASDMNSLFRERIKTVTPRNAFFVHLLVWDKRHTAEFFRELLIAIFDFTTYCEHVILVVPPRVTLGDLSADPRPTYLLSPFNGVASARSGASRYATRIPYNFPADVFKREMTRISPNGNDTLQLLYVAYRHQLRPKLKIRRVV